MKKLIITLIACAIFQLSPAQTWTNPHEIGNEWSLYGIGDPYLLKHNGLFYLYCSTRDSETGIKCWSSPDLLDWKYEGLCATDAKTKCAYAPEVIYYNGKFYMYTSPAGNGHFILESDLPTGPFTIVTGNLGHSIDGSVFKEDDGTLYFYHSGDDGIHGHKMNSPTSIISEVVLQSTRMNGWTEGPCVIKRNGTYYMIYTGNHVISPGYRVDLATSKTSPLSGFIPQMDENPVILNSEGEFIGLGHASMFIGPNLDAHFITYHNLAGDYGVGPFRHLNFDRIAFNGDKLLVLGPTWWDQKAPEMPDFFDFFDRSELGNNWTTSTNGNWNVSAKILSLSTSGANENAEYTALINQQPTGDFTAEFNIMEGATEKALEAGAIFGYTNPDNFSAVWFNKSINKLLVNKKINGTWAQADTAELAGVLNYNQWHAIRIEKSDSQLKIFVDGMLKFNLTDQNYTGQLGYISFNHDSKFSFAAFTKQVNGNSIYNHNLPVPGNIAAQYHSSYTSGVNQNVQGNYVPTNTGDKLSYKIMIQENTAFALGLHYATTSNDCQVRIWQNDAVIAESTAIPATESDSDFETFTIENFKLDAGPQTLTLEITSGNLNLSDLQIKPFKPVDQTVVDSFTYRYAFAWNYSDGEWLIDNKRAKASGCSKRTIGETSWTDYNVVVDVMYTDMLNGGILFRVTNPANGGPNNNPELGTDFLQGYYVTLSSGGVILGRQNYNYTELARGSGSFRTNKWYRLGVSVSGSNMKVYVDNFDTPLIDYTDPKPFITGKAGLRTFKSNVFFDNFKIFTGPISNINSITPKSTGAIHMYPNPAKNQVYLQLLADAKPPVELEIYNMLGILKCSRSLQNNQHPQSVWLGNLPKGNYMALIKTADQRFVYPLTIL